MNKYKVLAEQIEQLRLISIKFGIPIFTAYQKPKMNFFARFFFARTILWTKYVRISCDGGQPRNYIIPRISRPFYLVSFSFPLGEIGMGSIKIAIDKTSKTNKIWP